MVTTGWRRGEQLAGDSKPGLARKASREHASLVTAMGLWKVWCQSSVAHVQVPELSVCSAAHWLPESKAGRKIAWLTAMVSIYRNRRSQSH